MPKLFVRSYFAYYSSYLVLLLVIPLIKLKSFFSKITFGQFKNDLNESGNQLI